MTRSPPGVILSEAKNLGVQAVEILRCAQDDLPLVPYAIALLDASHLPCREGSALGFDYGSGVLEIERTMISRRRQSQVSCVQLRCLGRPVSRNQAACLVLCGWAVVVLNLHVGGIPMYLIPPGWWI